MYIKQVIIDGFKSYKEQTALDPFSPKLNVVVGANGSGKSNFFHAIRFVLSDIFVQLRAEDRQQLLHEGAGHAVPQAYVEVVFDNTDGRLPVDREEVRLRRVISAKEDKYLLDRKQVQKTEVQNMLESAGFSRANPYYVVQQGKIMKMTMMKENERLDLLKEIGGTRVYEERRSESLKIMRETEGRRKQVEEVITDLNKRLHDLDREREELHQYQQVDRKRRGVEFMIYDRELSDVRTRIEKLEADRRSTAAKTSEVHETIARAQADLDAALAALKKLGEEREKLAREKEDTSKEKDKAVKRAAQAELNLQEIRNRLASNATTRGAAEEELAALEKRIETRQQRLLEVTDEVARFEKDEAETSRELNEVTRQLNALYQKQGRESQFGSVEERDEWIRKQVASLQDAVRQKEAGLGKTREQHEQTRKAAEHLAKEVKRMEEQISSKHADARKNDDARAALEEEKSKLTERRKGLWRQQEKDERERAEMKEVLAGREGQLERSIARELNRGLQSVRALVTEHNIQGVHGTLMELFECPDHLVTAAEVTAGNALLHMVVDDDEVATKIVRLLNQVKGGRVTFLPLSKVRAPDVTYPDRYGDNVVPMIRLLKFDARYTVAMRHVFGKTVVCKNIDVATQVARETHLNCVTMQGDQVSKKGAMTGGFLDLRFSKMGAWRGLRAAQASMQALEERERARRAELADVDQGITRCMGELERLKVRGGREGGSLTDLRADLKDAQETLRATEKQCSEQEKTIKEAEQALSEMQMSVEALEKELGTPLTSTLSAEEHAQVMQLQKRQGDLQKAMASMRSKGIEARSEREAVVAELETNLGKRREELTQALREADAEADERELRRREQALEAARAEEGEARRRAEEVGRRLGGVEEKEAEARAAEEGARGIMASVEQEVEDERRGMERLMQRRSQLLNRRDELMRKIRELGSLPSDAFSTYQGLSAKQLQKVLAEANKEMSKFQHVNQKALDQYINFNEQRNELKKRMEELVAGESKVKELIATLDMRKNEAIERTFKQVAKNFRDIFSELAPGSKGELVMIKRNPEEAGHAGAEEEGVMDRYSGVKVKVSFGMGETLVMKQLSGGQKKPPVEVGELSTANLTPSQTLVSLALIFAIQRCDPAPFYLFDEIDAALDPQYRTTVAAMLRKQANDPHNPSQFIITTFHPQLVQVCDQAYGVSHSNRISTIDVITKSDALEFLDQNEEAADANAETSGPGTAGTGRRGKRARA